MKRRDLLTGLAAAALASGCASQAPGWVQASQARYGSPVALPPPTVTGTMPLEQALWQRRSRRAFRPDPLPIATIGQLLWAGQGITSPDGKRASPSAGALYPLELYAVTAAQVMHYLPQGHRAETRAVPDLRPRAGSRRVRPAACRRGPGDHRCGRRAGPHPPEIRCPGRRVRPARGRSRRSEHPAPGYCARACRRPCGQP